MAERRRDHASGGGGGAAPRQLPPRRARRARLRGALQRRVPDAGRVHAVGDPAAPRPLPGPRPRPRPHVQLRRPARRPLRALSAAAAVPLLQGRRHRRHRLPRLVLLGPEVNIKPWEPLLVDLKNGNERVKWKDREPYAFWKGNPWVAGTRQDLLKCNVSNGREWNARLFTQNWERAIHNGFKRSNLADQCVYRYKIYIEGRSWSVSEKYILACNSPTLLVTSKYQDFFTRGLMPGHHYWPIRPDHKCPSIKFAVDWGNKHQKEAQAIGKAGSGFIQDEVKMDYIYDYMLHLLTEYAKLLQYKPTVPEKATELCLESMACTANGLVKTFMTDSMAKWVHDSEPCKLPPPFDPKELQEISKRKDKAIKQVEMWERKA